MDVADDKRPRLHGGVYYPFVASEVPASGDHHVGRDVAHRDNARADGLR